MSIEKFGGKVTKTKVGKLNIYETHDSDLAQELFSDLKQPKKDRIAGSSFDLKVWAGFTPKK